MTYVLDHEEARDLADFDAAPMFWRWDPLRQMRATRADADRYARNIYNDARKRAMRPTLGQLRIVEAAIRCDVACRSAVQAWRAAA